MLTIFSLFTWLVITALVVVYGCMLVGMVMGSVFWLIERITGKRL